MSGRSEMIRLSRDSCVTSSGGVPGRRAVRDGMFGVAPQLSGASRGCAGGGRDHRGRARRNGAGGTGGAISRGCELIAQSAPMSEPREDGACDWLIGSWGGLEASAAILTGAVAGDRVGTLGVFGIRPWLSRRQDRLVLPQRADSRCWACCCRTRASPSVWARARASSSGGRCRSAARDFQIVPGVVLDLARRAPMAARDDRRCGCRCEACRRRSLVSLAMLAAVRRDAHAQETDASPEPADEPPSERGAAELVDGRVRKLRSARVAPAAARAPVAARLARAHRRPVAVGGAVARRRHRRGRPRGAVLGSPDLNRSSMGPAFGLEARGHVLRIVDGAPASWLIAGGLALTMNVTEHGRYGKSRVRFPSLFGLMVAGGRRRRPKPAADVVLPALERALAVLIEKHVAIELVPSVSLLYQGARGGVEALWLLGVGVSWRAMGQPMLVALTAVTHPAAAARRTRHPPVSLPPSNRFGTGSSVPCARSRQTLVAQARPSTVAFTGVRPHACVAGGACPSGMRANIHPPGPGYRHSFARNVFAFAFAFAATGAILSRAMTDVDALLTELRQFVAERDWSQFHDPKNLAMLLASEVGELVAEYRWVAGAAADAHSRDPARPRAHRRRDRRRRHRAAAALRPHRHRPRRRRHHQAGQEPRPLPRRQIPRETRPAVRPSGR